MVIARFMRRNERDVLRETAREWGYFNGSIKTRKDLWAGRRILDVGMGGGPHCVSFVENGASSYVGVDPLVGTDHVRDFRNWKDPSFPPYHAFPFSVDDIMRIHPNVHLYSGLVEDLVDVLKEHHVDFALMGAVSEHLRYPEKAIRAVWQALAAGSYIWISHCNYYSWTGHHGPPRSIQAWDRSNPTQNANVDWQHLDPKHPAYSNPNFNRIRLEDFKLVVEKYFEIVDWTVVIDGLPRLTPEIRQKWKKYPLAELLGRDIYVTARKRSQPLDIELADRQLFHPDEDYLADRDYTDEDLAPYRVMGMVYFSKRGEIHSHSDNDYAGLRVFHLLKPGDTIAVRKFLSRLRFTVAEVVRPLAGPTRLRLVEPVPETIVSGNHDQWSIAIDR